MFLIFKSTYKTPSDRKPSLTLSILFSHPLRWSVCQTSHSWWAPACRWVNEGPTLQHDKCEVQKNRILSALLFPHQICPAAPSKYISNSKRPIATSWALGIDLNLAWGNGRTNTVTQKNFHKVEWALWGKFQPHRTSSLVYVLHKVWHGDRCGVTLYRQTIR